MNDEGASAAVAAAPSPGAVLSAARRAQNLEVSDVARQLKLSASQVTALEADAHEQLPGPVFVRGFIRNYARLLKVDPELLLPPARNVETAEFAAGRPAEAAVPFPEQPRRHGWKFGAVSVAALVAAVAVYEFGYDDAPQPVTTLPASSAAAPIAIADQPPATAVMVTAPADAAAGARQDTPDTVVVANAQAPVAAEPAAVAEKSGAVLQGFEQLVKPGEARIQMTFDRESWVDVRDRNGNVIFSQLNAAGSVQQVDGVPPLSVVIGNARGVRLTFRDRAVDLTRHTKVDVARLTLN